jgi:hypothetical protein
MKTILIEKAEKLADLMLNKIMLECNKNIKECGCDEAGNDEEDNSEKDKENLEITYDDDDENELPNEEVDEQFNLAKAMKDPTILNKARIMVQKSGGRLSLKDAVIRVGGSASRFL